MNDYTNIWYVISMEGDGHDAFFLMKKLRKRLAFIMTMKNMVAG